MVGNAAAPAARCRKLRRGSFILNLPLALDHSITSSVMASRSGGTTRPSLWRLLAWSCPSRNRSCSHPSGHRLHQQRERCAEAPFAGRGAPIVAEAHHDEIVRWDDQGPLPARSRHVMRLLGQRETAVAINPEE